MCTLFDVFNKTSPSSYYVDNCDVDALAQAVIQIYANQIARRMPARMQAHPGDTGDGTNIGDPLFSPPLALVDRVMSEDQLRVLNQLFRALAEYIGRQNELIRSVHKETKDYHGEHNIVVAPLTESIVNARTYFDFLQLEQLFSGLAWKGTVKKQTKKKKV